MDKPKFWELDFSEDIEAYCAAQEKHYKDFWAELEPSSPDPNLQSTRGKEVQRDVEEPGSRLPEGVQENRRLAPDPCHEVNGARQTSTSDLVHNSKSGSWEINEYQDYVVQEVRKLRNLNDDDDDDDNMIGNSAEPYNTPEQVKLRLQRPAAR